MRLMSVTYQAHAQAQPTIHQPGSKLDEIMIKGACPSQHSYLTTFLLTPLSYLWPPSQHSPSSSSPNLTTMGSFQPSPPPKYTSQAPPTSCNHNRSTSSHELDSFQHAHFNSQSEREYLPFYSLSDSDWKTETSYSSDSEEWESVIGHDCHYRS